MVSIFLMLINSKLNTDLTPNRRLTEITCLYLVWRLEEVEITKNLQNDCLKTFKGQARKKIKYPFRHLPERV